MHSYLILIQLNNTTATRCIAGMLILALSVSFFGYPLNVAADATSTANTTESQTDDTATNGNSSGTDGETSSTSESVVATGDADADTDVFTESNTNTTDTDEDSATSTDTGEGTLGDAASSTAETASTSPEIESSTSTTATTTITNTNNATTTTNATTTADTGSNDASGEMTTISTGDATASANVVNVANTNIVNSNGLLAFFRYVFGLSELDIRDLFSVFDRSEDDKQATSTCNLSGCSDSTVSYNVKNENDAVISNDVVVRSETGGNTASGTDSYIQTGRAHAAANVVNVANTNIVDANYLMLTFSSFDDLLGDIVLPDDSVFEELFSRGALGDTTTVSNTNKATITNNVTAEADTGGNTATSASGTALVDTGTASAYSSTYNQVNTNIAGSDSFAMLFRVHGDWTGEVTGLPENMSVRQTPFGIELFNNTDTHQSSTAPTYKGLSVENDNTATIRNNVAVMAMSGNNTATGTAFSAIQSGDATASANVVNIANSNILGRNWALLIFDIFGDWNGNLSFGRPDLWLGAAAQSDNNPPTVGSDVDYTFTITNFSDTDATDVTLQTDFDSDELSFSDSSASWSIGDVGAGETVEVTYPATVRSGIPQGTHPLTLKAAVSSKETDDNPSDNTDSVTIMTDRGGSAGRQDPKLPGAYTFPSNLSVTKVADISTTTASSTVTYTITVENSGGRAFGSILYDTIFDEEGAVVVDQQWDLGTIYTDEEITVSYDVFFSGETDPGTYQNSAQVYAYDRSHSPNYGQNVESEIARVDVAIVEPEGAVLGAATTTAAASTCGRYIESYIRAGKQNDRADVEKLQRFLRSTEGFPNVSVNGVYDRTTEQAVRDLQTRYKEDVLTPWGLESATGNVYYTTQKKINELHCGADATFPLSSAQQHEIAQHRSTATPPLASHNNAPEPNDTQTVTMQPKSQPAPPRNNRHQTTTQEAPAPTRQSAPFTHIAETFFSWIKETFRLGLTTR